jgi:hypothetical protein
MNAQQGVKGGSDLTLFQQKTLYPSDNLPSGNAVYPGENRKEKGLKNPPC